MSGDENGASSVALHAGLDNALARPATMSTWNFEFVE
jgi:hypothetical protein